jgi:hypothetical protein
MEVVGNDWNIPNVTKIQKAREENASFLSDKNKTIPYSHQVQHPPLYYVLALLFFVPVFSISKGLIPAYYATRLISSLFYFLTLFIAIRIVKYFIWDERIRDCLVFVFMVNP